jgi:hypothetical protein
MVEHRHVIVCRGDELTEFTVESSSTAQVPEPARKAAGRL